VVDVFEGLLIDGGEVEHVGILFIVSSLVVNGVEGLLEQVGERPIAFCLISHLTNIILFYLPSNIYNQIYKGILHSFLIINLP
jgi:hypothetical protein